MEHEQLLIAADLAVVALLRFLESSEVLLQLFLGEEGCAVDPLHRLVARVALPVGVGGAQQLERLEPAGRRYVRPCTEIDERVPILDRVAGHLALALGLFVDQLHLEWLATVAKELLRLLARHHLPLVGEILPRELAHLLLDRLEIFGYKRTGHDEVVVEAVLYGGPDATLDARKQIRDGGGEQMRRAVSVEAQRFRAVRRHHPDLRVPFEWKRQIDQAVVHHRGHRGLGEAWRDRSRDVTYRRARRHGAAGAVRKRDGDVSHRDDGKQSTGRKRKTENGRRGWTRTTDLLRVREAL